MLGQYNITTLLVQCWANTSTTPNNVVPALATVNNILN